MTSVRDREGILHACTHPNRDVLNIRRWTRCGKKFALSMRPDAPYFRRVAAFPNCLQCTVNIIHTENNDHSYY